MDPVKLDEIRKKRDAQLKELKAKLKKRKEERSLPGAKVTDGAPNNLSEMEKLIPDLVEEAKKHKAALREAYSNREPTILRIKRPYCTAASPPAFSEDGEGKEA